MLDSAVRRYAMAIMMSILLIVALIVFIVLATVVAVNRTPWKDPLAD